MNTSYTDFVRTTDGHTLAHRNTSGRSFNLISTKEATKAGIVKVAKLFILKKKSPSRAEFVATTKHLLSDFLKKTTIFESLILPKKSSKQFNPIK